MIAWAMIAFDIQDALGKASGLIINRNKTVAIALCPVGVRDCIEWTHDIRLHATTDKCRYLGHLAGSRPCVKQSWDTAGAQLRIRIRLASHRILMVDQQAKVAAAIIIPKLLYVGRRSWPTTAIVMAYSKCIKNFVWTGMFEESASGSTHWLDEEVSSLPRREGGMAVLDLKAELLALAVTAASNWAVSGSALEHLLGDILLQDGQQDALPTSIYHSWTWGAP
ncbi:unnamed protein product [Phytophthora fragariaefolia]|uniref:Unnamed protein product n=1 Tax=Phytophthora fragariaefolia TaxID=1490495 RepID=A0A9W6XZS7_9STRA|nr:unnamed protein product [Phytophthora fragariaefolia]